MPDEKGTEKAEEDSKTSLHAYKDGREEDVEGSIPSGDQDARESTNTGGATSGGPPAALGEEADLTDHEKNADRTPEPGEDSEGEDAEDERPGGKGLGTESGAAGGANSPSNNPDPATKGATKGTKGAL